MTKKHYMAIAEIFNHYLCNNVDCDICEYSKWILKELVDYLESENPNFDRTKFLEACGV